MKKTVGPLVFVVILILFSVYGVGFLVQNETKVTDKEIIISRIGVVPFSATRYIVNLETGDEKIMIYGPHMLMQSWFVDYDGKRKCITTVYKHGYYYISLNYEGTVFYSTGETVHETIPYENVRANFEEGMRIRNMVRERYAGLLPQKVTIKIDRSRLF